MEKLPNLFNSPLLIKNELTENSPMSSLAIDLSGTTIGISARRKLSLSSTGDSPSLPPGSPMIVSPLKQRNNDRLLKTSLQLSGSGSTVRRGLLQRRSTSTDENYNPSPIKQAVSPSKFLAVRQLSSNGRVRQPLEDYDPNSQDSGYGHSEDSKSISSDFCFAQPSGLAPRRSATDSPHRPVKNLSTSSTESFDDGFNEFISPLQDEEAQMPPGLGSLISDPIINHGTSFDLSFKDCISENVDPLSPVCEEKPKKRASTTVLENTPVSKRHKPLSENSPSPRRMQQHTLFAYGFKRLGEPRPLLSHSVSLDESPAPARPKFRHCLSESEAVIKRALHRSTQEELIGDFSQSFALPLVMGHHQDLKSISPTTLARLINGEFSETITSFQIIDCRYPYEYEGGHIRGAKNIYTKDQILKEFLENKIIPSSSANKEDTSGRNIVIFHCEFSSERGPGLSRFLRSKDRERNAYPSLHHPELYLLEGGYKAFYLSHRELCEPCAYRTMLDADKDQLQHFRAKSKTWSGDKSNRTLKRSTSFKRLGL